MIIGAPPAVRARALKPPGAFSRPLRAARRLRENTGVRFRDAPGVFCPARREMCAAFCGLGGEPRVMKVEKGPCQIADRSRSMKVGKRVKTFGELIARRRKELGLTQSELGARIKGRSGEPVSQKRI